LGEKIATQKQKIEDFNKAMTTLVLNAIAAGKTVDQYIKDSKAGKGDAADLITTGKAVGAIKGDVKGIDVAAKTMELMGKPISALESSLKSKGITMDGGDLYITVGGKSKKLDVSANENAKQTNAKVISTTTGTGTFAQTTNSVSATSLFQSGVSNAVGTTFKDANGKVWKITGQASSATGWNIPVQKAGYGTMKLDPKIPTIVGDRGPEMAFGGMIIPNMAKIPFSSPRYDVNQAAKMFEPMRDASVGASVINLTQNIYPSDGMNTDTFVRQVVAMTKQAIGQDAKLNAKMVGTTKNVSIKP
jgi:hypothetical protein